MLSAKDVRGVVAVLATPAKPGADSVLATDTVDLDETARVTEKLIKDGADSIMALGTTGECATLSDEDYRTFVDTFLSVVNGRVPTFVGTTALGSHEIAKRVKFVKERGASATLMGIPMWQPATLDMAVRHYADFSEAFPDFPIMVYGNSGAFRFSFPVEFWEGVAKKAPTVVAAKFGNTSITKQVVDVTGGRISLVAVDRTSLDAAKQAPGSITALWTLAAGINTAAALIDAINAGDWDRAEQVRNDINWAMEFTQQYRKPEIFASFNIQLNRVAMDASGYTTSGPMRPPYQISTMPQEYIDNCIIQAERWNELEKKYAGARAQAVGGGGAS
jgi:dihydrodipicolinate synthase/N-acetylneuraminate lyase